MRTCTALLLLSGGCLQSSGEPIAVSPVHGHSRGTSSGGSSSRSSIGTATTSTGGTSSSGSAGSSGSSSSGFSSNSSGGSPGLDAGINCPDVYIETRFYDGLLYTPIAGVNAQALDENDVPIPGSSSVSNADGVAICCVPHGVQVTLTANATGYPPVYMENAVLTFPWVFGLASADGGSENGLLMLSTSTLEAVGPLFGTPLSLAQPVVVVDLTTLAAESPCRSQKSGWQIGMSLLDGGAMAAGSYVEAYMGLDELPDPDAGLTTQGGVVLFYNIDLSISAMRVTAVNTNADAGDCPSVNAAIGLTGVVETNNGEMTYAPIMMP